MKHLLMKLLLLLLLAVVARTLPMSLDHQEEEENFQEEFEYFYNLELVDKLELLGDNETNITEEDVDRIVNHDTHDPQIDDILDKMIDQRNLIEGVLNEIEAVRKSSVLTKKAELDFSSSLLHEIVYWVLLVGSVLTLTVSFLMTTKYILDHPKSVSTQHVKSNLEFEFFPGRLRI